MLAHVLYIQSVEEDVRKTDKGEYMKTFLQLAVIVAIAGLMGCKNSSSTNNNNNGTVTTLPAAIIIDPSAPVATDSTISNSYGSTVTFKPVSLSVMNAYVATHPLNNPTNFKINFNLAHAGSGRYGGEVTISYIDNGVQYDGVFKSGLGKNQSFKGMYDNDRLESDYNYWFSFENKNTFTGFFEDQYGAITISLVPQTTTTSSGNDGEPITATAYKGYVYFKNFTTTTAPHSPYRACWFTYMGPYDCRSNVIQTKCGLNPGAEAGYQLLGTFENVSVKQAFNLN